MTMTKQKSKSVGIWVPWSTSEIECKVPRKTWDRIVAGRKESHSFRIAFEDFRGDVYFRFNDQGYGSLYAYYGDDGGEIFIGDLGGAAIVIDGHQVPWSDLRTPKRQTAPPKKPASSENSRKPIKRPIARVMKGPKKR
jgi:hypothetical protein